MNARTRRSLWDGRFTGKHGIARFATEVYRNLSSPPPKWSDARFPPYSMLAPLEAAREIRRTGSGLLVSPSYAVAAPGRHRQLLTVHDLILLDVQEETSLAKRVYFERLVRPAIQRSGAVMTVSEFSKRRLIEWTGLAPENVFMVGNGCSMPILEQPEAAIQGRVADPYVLFVGNERVHKNFRLVVQAMTHVDNDVRLVTVGLSDPFLDAECTLAGLERTRVTGMRGIDDAQLTQLYTGASCLAVPSTYEGFGLIALEALARGVPSVYCCEAVAEVVGDAGLRSPDTLDDVAFAATIDQALAGALPVATLTARAEIFRWQDVAERVALAELAVAQG